MSEVVGDYSTVKSGWGRTFLAERVQRSVIVGLNYLSKRDQAETGGKYPELLSDIHEMKKLKSMLSPG